jgi:hypothetical protein
MTTNRRSFAKRLALALGFAGGTTIPSPDLISAPCVMPPNGVAVRTLALYNFPPRARSPVNQASLFGIYFRRCRTNLIC